MGCFALDEKMPVDLDLQAWLRCWLLGIQPVTVRLYRLGIVNWAKARATIDEARKSDIDELSLTPQWSCVSENLLFQLPPLSSIPGDKVIARTR